MRELAIDPKAYDVAYDENVVLEQFADGRVTFQLALIGEDRIPGINVLVDGEDEGDIVSADYLEPVVEWYDQLKTKVMPEFYCGWLESLLPDDWNFDAVHRLLETYSEKAEWNKE